MVFNATFNNISVISWRSALLVEETGVLGENHQPAVSPNNLYPIILYPNTHRHERSVELALLNSKCNFK
jgi:hypothetical protein